jgi:hypothetical protein
VSSAELVAQWCRAILTPAVPVALAWLAVQVAWGGVRGRF